MKPKAEPITNLIDCPDCDGMGEVEATCNGCGCILTVQNVAAPFGTEGDDVCEACEQEDAEVQP